MNKKRYKQLFVSIAAGGIKILLITLISAFTALPFVWMISSCLKPGSEVMSSSSFLPSTVTWDNLISVITSSPIPTYIFNTMWISLVIVALQVITSALLAYALVFMKFRSRNILFGIIMATYMLPVAATYIPSYIILSKMNLLNTFTGLIISSTVSTFGIFQLRQAFMQIPKSLVEAARIDGSSHLEILCNIVGPMTKSSFITLGLMSFISAYNNYMWPSLITNDPDKYLVSQGLRSFFIEGGAYGTSWGLVMAASAVIIVPLLVMFALTEKWFVNGIGGETGVKG